MNKIASVLALLLVLAAPALAQQSKSSMTATINTNLPDNTSGAITPAAIRNTMIAMVNSYVDAGGATSSACPTGQYLTGFLTLSTLSCSQVLFSQLGSTPTTLAGYGITDAQPHNSVLDGLSTVGTTAKAGFVTNNLGGPVLAAYSDCHGSTSAVTVNLTGSTPVFGCNTIAAGSSVWSLVGGTGPDIYFNSGNALVGKTTSEGSYRLQVGVNNPATNNDGRIFSASSSGTGGARAYIFGSDNNANENFTVSDTSSPSAPLFTIQGRHTSFPGQVVLNQYSIGNVITDASGKVWVSPSYSVAPCAVADGLTGTPTDNTTCFQNVINARSSAGGGPVDVPGTGSQCYGFADPGHLTLPKGVWLQGVGNNASFKRAEGATKGYPIGGSCLSITDTTNPFITYGTGTTAQGGMGVRGITFFYPNQTETNPPVAYPATIQEAASGSLTDVFVTDSVFMNSYIGMKFLTLAKSRLVIQNVTGEFLNRGLVADNVQDWSQIRNFYDEVFVWSANASLLTYRLNNDISLDLQGMAVAVEGVIAEHMYALAQFSTGVASGAATSGTFNNFHMDDCNNGFIVNATQNGGITLDGGELVCTNNGYGIQNAGGNVVASNITSWGNFRILYYQTGGQGILSNWNAGAAVSNYLFNFSGGSGQLNNILVPGTTTAVSGALSITGGTDFFVSQFNSIPAGPSGNINIATPGGGISNIIFTNNICRGTNSIPHSGSGVAFANNLGTC